MYSTGMETGQIFGRLTAIERVDGERWKFRCQCGNEKVMYRRNVTRGASQSCGCLQRETTARVKTTHGHSKGRVITPEFQTYRSMMARCYRASNNRYCQYGERGIEVCERWRNSFQTFLDDMGPRPSRLHSLDRVDNDADYSPQNCRWATRRQQCRNRSSNIIVSVAGQSMTLIEASERFDIKYGTLKARILKHGWDHDRAVSTPAPSRSA